MNRHLAIKMSCFSVIAPRQLLLRCPNKLHPCNDALPYYLPSMAVPEDRRNRVTITVHFAKYTDDFSYDRF